MLKANNNWMESEKNMVVMTIDDCWKIPKQYNNCHVFNRQFCYEKFRKEANTIIVVWIFLKI